MGTLNHVSGVWLHFFPTTLNREGEKPSKYCNKHCFCRRRELNPGRLRSKQVRYPLLHCLSAKTIKDNYPSVCQSVTLDYNRIKFWNVYSHLGDFQTGLWNSYHITWSCYNIYNYNHCYFIKCRHTKYGWMFFNAYFDNSVMNHT